MQMCIQTKIVELEYKLDLTTQDTSATRAYGKDSYPPEFFIMGTYSQDLLDSIATAFMVYEPPN